MAIGCGRARDLAPAFVLGALDPGEMDAVREHLATCREGHPEFRELGGVATYLGQAVEPVEPSVALRERILSAARTDLRGRQRNAEAAERLVATLGGPRAASAPDAGAADAATPAPIEIAAAASFAAATSDDAGRADAEVGEVPGAVGAGLEGEPAPVTSLAGHRGGRRTYGLGRSHRTLWLLRGIAAVVIVGLIGGLGMHEIQMQQEIDKTQKITAGIDSLGNAPPATKSLLLFAPGAAGANGVGFVTPSGHVGALLHGLAPTKGHQVYELWLVHDGGTPVPAKTFAVDDTGRAYVEADGAIAAGTLGIEISREDGSGATAPSQPLVASGTITY